MAGLEGGGVESPPPAALTGMMDEPAQWDRAMNLLRTTFRSSDVTTQCILLSDGTSFTLRSCVCVSGGTTTIPLLPAPLSKINTFLFAPLTFVVVLHFSPVYDLLSPSALAERVFVFNCQPSGRCISPLQKYLFSRRIVNIHTGGLLTHF